MTAFVANSFKDACEFLICYLVDQAYATTNTRAADQVMATGVDGDEFATVRIMSSDSDFGSSFKSFANARYPAWSATVAYTAGALVSVGANAYACTHAVTGGAGPAADTAHWSAAAQTTQTIETTENLYTFTTSIQFFRHKTPANDGAGLAQFGLGAFDKASRLATRLGQQDMLDLMDTMNLGIDGNSPARNVSALVNSGYFEDRGSVDFTFTIPNSETLLLNTFAAAGITLQFASPGQPAPDTRTITETQP
jgi:hypothetical protein